MCKSDSDSNDNHKNDYHATASGFNRLQTFIPAKEEDEEESQTDQQGSYESDAYVEPEQTEVSSHSQKLSSNTCVLTLLTHLIKVYLLVFPPQGCKVNFHGSRGEAE